MAAGTHRGGVLLVQHSHARGGLLGKSREKGKRKKKNPFGFEYILYAFTVVWLKKTKKKNSFRSNFLLKKTKKKRKGKKTHLGVFTSALLKIILQASPSCRPSAKHPVGLERSSPLPERSNVDR